MGIHRKPHEWERLTNSEQRFKLPNSLPEARKASKDYYYTGVPCKHGHLTVRRVKISGCPRSVA